MRALGIINFEDNTADVGGLDDYRPVPAIAFMGRYRVIDFILSNMTNSGIQNVQVYCKEKPRNLMEHLGTGQHYNINSKRGKLQLLFQEASQVNQIYNTDIEAFEENLSFIERMTNEYVVIAPSYMIYTQDYNKLLDAHIESGADVTMLYHRVTTAKDAFVNCDVLTLTRDKTVTAITRNDGSKKTANISMATYVMTKDQLIKLIKEAKEFSSAYTLPQIINELLASHAPGDDDATDWPEDAKSLNVKAVQHKGYFASCMDFKDYVSANLDLLDMSQAESLFTPGWTIYTRTNDSCPTKYCEEASVKRSMISNGCVIRGTVEDSVLGRGVKIGKGAVIKNCIIAAYVTIGDGVTLEGQVVDKWASVTKTKNIVSDPENPGYIRRADRL